MQIPPEPSISPVTSTNIATEPRLQPNAGQSGRKNVLSTEQSGAQADLGPVPESTEPTVTFRRDTNGQIYYILSDPQSGKELRELPPEEVRKVGQGIADYLKQAQEKPAPPRIQVKA
jgi:hypothetical protein